MSYMDTIDEGIQKHWYVVTVMVLDAQIWLQIWIHVHGLVMVADIDAITCINPYLL